MVFDLVSAEPDYRIPFLGDTSTDSSKEGGEWECAFGFLSDHENV